MDASGNEKGKVSVWAPSEKQADYVGSAECPQLAVKRDMKITQAAFYEPVFRCLEKVAIVDALTVSWGVLALDLQENQQKRFQTEKKA